MRGEASRDLQGARRAASWPALLALALTSFCFVLVGGPLGADDVTVALPRSDVVTSAKPCVITLTGPAQAARGRGEAAIALRRAEPGVKDAAPVTSSVTCQSLRGGYPRRAVRWTLWTTKGAGLGNVLNVRPSAAGS